MNGRRKQAARNDERILAAAREVFLADPGAPISAVSAHAQVGISALYSRYANKEGLLRALAGAALEDLLADVTAALDDLAAGPPDPERAWTVYCECLGRIVDGRSQALAQRLAGTFRPTPELGELAARAGTAVTTLHRRVTRAGALRRDVSAADVTLLLEAVMTIDVPDESLRRRYLAVVTQSLRAPGGGALPGRPAEESDLAERWRRGADRA
ncbi:TetR/AcrR family transcriptional regulator [Jatrophihabitans fulvus]